MREQGIYSNIDIEEYHCEEGISSSGISLILDCPKRYWHEYRSGRPKEPSLKFDIGRALHMLVLEQDKFLQNFYFMEEDLDLRTKAGKESYAEYERIAHGRTLIRAKDAEDIRGMGNSLVNHELSSKFKEGKVEQSIYWDGGIYGTRLRTRPDFYNDDIIIDLKTTESIKSFEKSIFQYGYHRQAAMQIDGLEACDGKRRMFGLFVVEKKAPYLTACFTLDEAVIQKGREEYLDAASTYHECLKYDNWPGYDEKFTLVKLPKWLDKEI